MTAVAEITDAPVVHENGIHLVYPTHDYKETRRNGDPNARCRRCDQERRTELKYYPRFSECLTTRPQPKAQPDPVDEAPAQRTLNSRDRARQTPATPKQVAFLRKLIAGDPSAATDAGIAKTDLTTLSKTEASKYIDWMLNP